MNVHKTLLAAEKVYKAWRVEGVNPAYHRQQMARLHKEWPVLAKAIEELVNGMQS